MKSLPAAGTTIALRAFLTLATAAVARPARGQAVAAVDGALARSTCRELDTSRRCLAAFVATCCLPQTPQEKR